MNKGDSMGEVQQTNTGSRKSKFRRKPQRSTKPVEAWRLQVVPDDEMTESEEIDRLLLSSLRYWEVERDLIEERLAAKGRGAFRCEETRAVAVMGYCRPHMPPRRSDH